MEELIALNPYMLHVYYKYKGLKYKELKDLNVPDWYIWMLRQK